jgi:hypothetical protein
MFLGLTIVCAASEKAVCVTYPADKVQAEIIGPSKKMGELNGDVYYFKYAGSGTGQIFRVCNGDPTKVAAVGLIMENKYSIAEGEKSNFYAVVTDKPATYFTGETPSTATPAAQPAGGTATPPAAASAPIEGTAVQDGDSTVVKFTGGKYGGDTVTFRKGNDVVVKTGDQMKGELVFGGGGRAAGSTAKSILQLGIYTGGRGAVLDPTHNWTIKPYVNGKEMPGINTELQDGSRGHSGDPNGLAGETLAAYDIARKINPDLQLPSDGKLRQLASQ